MFGRPNVGKSTLVNALVGRKVSIVSDHPQTTRRRITGVVTLDDCQIVLLDLPGFQKPFDSLTRRMQTTVDDALEEVDAALVLLNATETFGPGDRYITHAVATAGVPAVTVLNKIDLVDGPGLGARLEEARALAGDDEVLAVSALRGDGLTDVLALLAAAMPPGPVYFPEGAAEATSPRATRRRTRYASRPCGGRATRCRTPSPRRWAPSPSAQTGRWWRSRPTSSSEYRVAEGDRGGQGRTRRQGHRQRRAP